MIAKATERTKREILPTPPEPTNFNCRLPRLADNDGMASAMAEETETVELLSVADVAWILDLSGMTVRRLYDDGELSGPPRRCHRRIYTDSVRRFIGNDKIARARLERRIKQLSSQRK